MRTHQTPFQRYPLRFLLCCVLCFYILTLYPYNFRQNNNAVFSVGLSLTSPGTGYTTHPHEALAQLYQFTILLHLSPETDDLGRTGRIFSSAKDFYSQNFAISQVRNTLTIQLFSRDSRHYNEVTIPDVFRTKDPLWIAITFTGDILRCYVNGVKKSERKTGPMALTQWDAADPLVVGTDPNGLLQWEGILHTVAILDRSCTETELQRPVLIFKKYSSIIHYEFDQGRTLYVRSSGTDADSLYVPALYQPYSKVTLFDTFHFLGKQRLSVRDIAANILFFLPVGFFSTLFFGRGVNTKAAIITLSVIMGMSLSVSAEVLQIFLPSRYSSMIDVLSNTMGTAFGAIAGLIHSNKGMHDDQRRNVEDRS